MADWRPSLKSKISSNFKYRHVVPQNRTLFCADYDGSTQRLYRTLANDLELDFKWESQRQRI